MGKPAFQPTFSGKASYVSSDFCCYHLREWVCVSTSAAIETRSAEADRVLKMTSMLPCQRSCAY